MIIRLKWTGRESKDGKSFATNRILTTRTRAKMRYYRTTSTMRMQMWSKLKLDSILVLEMSYIMLSLQLTTLNLIIQWIKTWWKMRMEKSTMMTAMRPSKMKSLTNMTNKTHLSLLQSITRHKTIRVSSSSSSKIVKMWERTRRTAWIRLHHLKYSLRICWSTYTMGKSAKSSFSNTNQLLTM